MLMPLLAILSGLLLLIWSADRFVDGAAATAGHLGLSPLLIGMLVIGFGTSAPEMMVSGLAAWQGNPGLALGNAYGSNITNVGLILGLVALISPLTVHSQVLKKELPLLAAVTLLAAWQLRDGAIGTLEAIVLLVVLGAFIGLSIWKGRQSEEDALSQDTRQDLEAGGMSLKAGILWTLLGLVLLIASSRALVWGAVEVAQAFGISDLIIGLTVVAIGTSLPELASSISALRRKEHDLVLGNVVGSNLFNTLGVVGIAGVITPVHVGSEVLLRDWPVMAVMTLLMLIFGIGWKGRQGRINRFEGAALLTIFIGYTSYLVYTVVHGASSI
ncbi:calcium/sodium antiporter [Pistricoccus aurantiacus]|uniref:Calcium/sodium antiporter n=1 Tax=Pistricoccus aurantiacus TaxID=1883414 RepID=A0A5B8SY77_9GAMM|nr:calcium/sodium antiporter [Pistricoccus aurantiacus]QEA39770.1 calcium/sodium antiporter [Pistricoccus aurantiacus]